MTVFLWIVFVAITPMFSGPYNQSTCVIYSADLFSNFIACNIRLALAKGKYFRLDLKILFLRLPLQISLFSKWNRFSTSSSILLSRSISGIGSMAAQIRHSVSLKGVGLWNCITSERLGRKRTSLGRLVVF